jgi:hypothetical protein
MQGKNIRFTITRYTSDPDDVVGGAVLTGTSVYTNMQGRIQGSLIDAELLALNPGLETDDVFRVTVHPAKNKTILPRDGFTITSPTNHPYVNLPFRVLKRIYSNFVPSDPRFYMILTVSRSVESHQRQ